MIILRSCARSPSGGCGGVAGDVAMHSALRSGQKGFRSVSGTELHFVLRSQLQKNCFWEKFISRLLRRSMTAPPTDLTLWRDYLRRWLSAHPRRCHFGSGKQLFWPIVRTRKPMNTQNRLFPALPPLNGAAPGGSDAMARRPASQATR